MKQMAERTYPAKVFKFCPKCSGVFVPQKDFSFVCSTCGLHFFSNACAAVCALILDSEGNLLLTTRAKEPKKGMLDLPGGFVDPLESIEDAVKREIREELGLNVIKMKYFCSFPNRYIYSGLTYFTIDLAFICEVDDLSKICPDDDVSGTLFIKPGMIDIDGLAFESIKNIIRKFVSSGE
jgi:NADH pyrophosphatase NudC (nudix superfamily)